MTKTIDEKIDELSVRLNDLESKRKSFFVVSDWRDLLTIVGIPLAVVTGVLAFYDTIWLRLKHEDPATLQAVEIKFVELQDLNAEIYKLLNENNANGLAGLDEAKRGRKERLVTSIHRHYQDRPDYFNYHEKQSLANELMLQGKAKAALAIATTMEPESRNIFESVDLALFEARILQTEGAAIDLNGAREKLKEALKLTEKITRLTPRQEMIGKIVYYWTYLETWHEQSCDKIEKPASLLFDLTSGAEYPIDLGILNNEVVTLLDIADARCKKP